MKKQNKAAKPFNFKASFKYFVDFEQSQINNRKNNLDSFRATSAEFEKALKEIKLKFPLVKNNDLKYSIHNLLNNQEFYIHLDLKSIKCFSDVAIDASDIDCGCVTLYDQDTFLVGSKKIIVELSENIEPFEFIINISNDKINFKSWRTQRKFLLEEQVKNIENMICNKLHSSKYSSYKFTGLKHAPKNFLKLRNF